MRELALHVLDILQNAAEAGASRVELLIVEDPATDTLAITVTDNGRGMDADAAARAANPFYTTRTTRHVGLGLPLWAAAAERAGGGLKVESRPGRGTRVAATFRLSHPDRQPMGNLPDTLLAFLLSGNRAELVYQHRVAGAAFELDSAEVRAILDGTPMGDPHVRRWLADYIAEGEAALGSKA